MASICNGSSCNDAAAELLRQCVAGEHWDRELALRLAQSDCSDALFRILIEGLADRFDPSLCDDYAAIFALVLETVLPELSAADTYARFQRVRRPRVCTVEPRRVVVLSRVTLGADIAITSVLLDAMVRRFPQAEIQFAGSAKAFELFAGCERLQHLEVPYARNGSVLDRIGSWRTLAAAPLDDPSTIVVDPDSRLTQLGLLPACDESRYFFFESRGYGGDSDASLTALAQRWAQATFGVDRCRNFIRPALAVTPAATLDNQSVTVSLGTADNPAKQLPANFEAALIRLLCQRFREVIVDRGFGPDESARVEHAIAGTTARPFTGSFARFASVIAASACYVGYDSGGQHAAAASGTPLITLFKGFASDRMFARWQPTGDGLKQILRVEDTDLPLAAVSAALDRLGFSSR